MNSLGPGLIISLYQTVFATGFDRSISHLEFYLITQLLTWNFKRKVKREVLVYGNSDTLLDNRNFVEHLSEEVERIQHTFSYLDPKRLWEILKFEIANICKEFSQTKKQEERDHLFDLYRLLGDMQDEAIDCDQEISDKLNSNISNVKEEINGIEDKKVKGAIFRCKAN